MPTDRPTLPALILARATIGDLAATGYGLEFRCGAEGCTATTCRFGKVLCDLGEERRLADAIDRFRCQICGGRGRVKIWHPSDVLNEQQQRYDYPGYRR